MESKGTLTIVKMRAGDYFTRELETRDIPTAIFEAEKEWRMLTAQEQKITTVQLCEGEMRADDNCSLYDRMLWDSNRQYIWGWCGYKSLALAQRDADNHEPIGKEGVEVISYDTRYVRRITWDAELVRPLEGAQMPWDFFFTEDWEVIPMYRDDGYEDHLRRYIEALDGAEVTV